MKYTKTGSLYNAVATKRGIEQENGVMLIAAKLSKKEIDEFNGVIKYKEIDEMSKIELEKKARTKGVELDRREKKSTLIGKVKKIFN